MPAPSFVSRLRPFLVAWPVIGLVAGLAARFAGNEALASVLWIVGSAPVLAVLVAEIAGGLRRGDFGLDVVAALSMSAAMAIGEHLAAAIVALMYAGGQYLENFAERRAQREMTALLARVPRSAMLHSDGALVEVLVERLEPGDRLLIRRGDVIPVDGRVVDGVAVLDQSALTGEAMPVRLNAGDDVLSGSTNAGDAFDLMASHRAADSTYAGVVRLAEEAQRSRAPMARMADRFAMVFLGVTVLLAGLTGWLTGDPVRVVAVLVVATPCPLILAVPVALMAGISRAAKSGILIKSGKALEMLARVRALVIDKTGTLTVGTAHIVDTRVADAISPSELLRLAASLDQASKHIIAETLVAAAREQGLALSVPTTVEDTPGAGLSGRVDGRLVSVGGFQYVADRVGDAELRKLSRSRPPGAVGVAVAVDGKAAGVIVLADRVREGTEDLLRRLREQGIERIVLATGDRMDVARFVGAGLRLDLVRADLTPDQKVLVVLSERKNGPVMMIGDGVNDAPALAAADLGVAMGARGAAASSEAADVVLLVDRLDRILPAIGIARRSRAIALQSVVVGIGLSFAAMLAAAAGYLQPVEGALLQEVIDVAVIFNALRALRA
ncbi:heavy metal translocating P-type ATPase [Undibacter mobilis]|uniref:P-type Zn(2+) transporter n=1 Tax=Undibacter mobilis TaxID=2292256 RepID=A0A371BDG1_9BRAD|nr:heavy metal translocating P-type ATPase [Undibacter mobilis]RDV05645.1 heavy metal translocating P-type ATPase [Undibacter mobilis]